MKKRIYTIATLLLIALLATSTVYAGGNIKLSGAVTKGSLHFDGFMTGLGGYKDGVTVRLTGFGKPVVMCISNYNHNDKRAGSNAGKIIVYDEQEVSSNTTSFEKGKAPVGLVISDSDIILPPSSDGCQEYRKKYHYGWTVKLIDVIWTQVYVDIYDGENISGTLLRHQEYTCNQATQTLTYINCTLTVDKSYH